MTQSTDPVAPQGAWQRGKALIRRANAFGGHLPYDLVALPARLAPAMVFWQSARTKVDGISIKDSTWFLFEHVYALPIIPPATATVLATVAEHVLPVLLVLGLFSRLSALGLLGMTAVIQLFVFPDAWVTHALWAASLVCVVALGPGRLSLDHVFGLEARPPKR